MSVMAFDTPKSSMTSRVAYNPEDRVLTMHVRSGKPIHLADVPVEHYHGMQKVESTGKYYHAHLKGFKPAK